MLEKHAPAYINRDPKLVRRWYELAANLSLLTSRLAIVPGGSNWDPDGIDVTYAIWSAIDAHEALASEEPKYLRLQVSDTLQWFSMSERGNLSKLNSYSGLRQGINELTYHQDLQFHSEVVFNQLGTRVDLRVKLRSSGSDKE